MYRGKFLQAYLVMMMIIPLSLPSFNECTFEPSLSFFKKINRHQMVKKLWTLKLGFCPGK